MNSVKAIALVVTTFLLMASSWAQSAPVYRSAVRIQGHSDVIVTEPTIHLGDVAQIDSASVMDDEAIIKLRTIGLGRSPKVGESVILEGVRVLEQMRNEGIQLDSVRYSFPRQIKVTRAFREVSSEELQKALQAFLNTQERNIDLKQIVMEKPVKIPTDSFGVEVVGLHRTQPGHLGVDYRSVAGSDEVRFQLRAVADEWRLMPVAAQPLKRGAVISAADVQLNKVNGTAAGRDVLEQIGDIVGKSLVRDVGQGEMFKVNAVVTPPVINSGSRVSMIYRQGRLEASAVGIALESGGEGQEIKVKNEGSKKIVSARVVEKGLVEVGVQ